MFKYNHYLCSYYNMRIFLGVCYIISKNLGIFLAMFLLLISSLNPLWFESILSLLSIFSFDKLHFMAQNVIYFWRMSHVRRTCILLLLGPVFYKCQLNPVDWWCYSVQLYPYSLTICCICQLLTEEWCIQLLLWICWYILAVWSVFASCILLLYC